MANPNIVATTTIRGKTDVAVIGTTEVSIATNASASGKVLKVNCLTLANIGTSSGVDVDVAIKRSGANFYVVKNVTIPLNASLVAVGKDNMIYLNEGDILAAVAGTSGEVHAICSYEEIS